MLHRLVKCLLCLLLFAAALPAQAQTSIQVSIQVSIFVFAKASDGRAVLGANDDYVRATAPLERSAKLRTSDNVDEARYRRFMEESVLEWTDAERERLQLLVTMVEGFLKGAKGKRPDRILLVKVDDRLEDALPHTRGNAIILPARVINGSAQQLSYVLSHETFHVLSRADAALQERLYQAIGFTRCEEVDIPDAVGRLRVTNPDAPVSRHTIRVRHLGKPVDALPFIRFPSTDIDPRAGFINSVETAWLLVDREGGVCRARRAVPEERGVAPVAFEGLYEQIGRNTQYLFHPEEILADNFVLLFYGWMQRTTPRVPSPVVLERMEAIMFRSTTASTH